MQKICDKCHGLGRIEVDDPEASCEATIAVGSEEPIHCFASRPHPGWPHMAILCEPCAMCGQFEEHDETCGLYEMTEVKSERRWVSLWWFWRDGDLTVTRDLAWLGQAWRDAFQPGSPYAKGGAWHRAA